jgi:hypothetical protein
MLPMILAAALLATACGAAATATPQSKEAPRPTTAPTPTQPTAVEKPAAISEEQSREELKRARFSTDEWGRTNFRIRSVPLREFTGGGPGKDDIPPIDAPKFETVAQADKWLADREAVQVVDVKGDARAYPQQILIWHEVVNDTVGGEPVTITY